MILYTNGLSWILLQKANYFVWALFYVNAMYQIRRSIAK